MAETRKLAAILAADVVGYSRLAGADEDRTLARLRALRSDLIDPTIAVHHGRVVKRTGDGILIEFRSVVDAVRCAIEVQNSMVERNAGLPAERRIEFRVGIHLGDVVEESDGDLMGEGVNIAARLEGVAKPGGICLSEDAYRQVKSRLDLAVSDLGPTELKNIAEPMRLYSLQVGLPAQAKPAAPLPQTSAPRLSIVVLPFTNMGGDPEQEYFVDGVTESLTTDLSRISGSLVIGRNTAFTYKGKAVDLKQVGNELGVRYVLEGSVQRGGNRLRVNVQLIDAKSGKHLWAERFDKPLADLFDMQDEIVAHLANQLGTELVAAEARRSEWALQPDSMDLYFQGLASANRGLTPEYMAQARGFFERALALDPGNIQALVGTAMVDSLVGGSFFVDDRAARFAAAEMTLIKALSLARIMPWPITCWVSSKSLPTARVKALPNASGRWRWIEIWPALMRRSVSPSIISVAPRKPRIISVRRSASLLAIRARMPGRRSRATPSSISVATRKRQRGCIAPSRPTEVIPSNISLSAVPWRISVSWMMRGLRFGQDLR